MILIVRVELLMGGVLVGYCSFEWVNVYLEW